MPLGARLKAIWRGLIGRNHDKAALDSTPLARQIVVQGGAAIDIAPNDPVIDYFQKSPNLVEVENIVLDSPAVESLKAAGVRLVVPLVSQGELIGLLSLGPRLSGQEYSSDDRKLLNDLATQAVPAVRVAQLVRQQEVEARQRERIEQELRIASDIQQTLLPDELPVLDGWRLAAYYQPAREVGGDFYDFFELPNGTLGIVVGDVTDKGVPAALVMATTRSVLRASSIQTNSPGEVLKRANEIIYLDIPPNMFVTCFYAILDPASGHIRFANAGHDLPQQRTESGVVELRARGMPLGLMPGMEYEEDEVTLAPGDSVLFYSDGLVEAHNPQREMFGFPLLKRLLDDHKGDPDLIDYLLDRLSDFAGAEWEQEDDVTLVTLQRDAPPFVVVGIDMTSNQPSDHASDSPKSGDWTTLAEFDLPSAPGNERVVVARIMDSIGDVQLSSSRIEMLKTAIAETAMNAIEHCNNNDPEIPVIVRLLASSESLHVQISGMGGNHPDTPQELPDLEAKLEGRQTPRGWGLFLIQQMVDEMRESNDGVHHTFELIMKLGEGDDAESS